MAFGKKKKAGVQAGQFKPINLGGAPMNTGNNGFSTVGVPKIPAFDPKLALRKANRNMLLTALFFSVVLFLFFFFAFNRHEYGIVQLIVASVLNLTELLFFLKPFAKIVKAHSSFQDAKHKDDLHFFWCVKTKPGKYDKWFNTQRSCVVIGFLVCLCLYCIAGLIVRNHNPLRFFLVSKGGIILLACLAVQSVSLFLIQRLTFKNRVPKKI